MQRCVYFIFAKIFTAEICPKNIIYIWNGMQICVIINFVETDLKFITFLEVSH